MNALPPPNVIRIDHLKPEPGQRPMVRLVDPRTGSGPALSIRQAGLYLHNRDFRFDAPTALWRRQA